MTQPFHLHWCYETKLPYEAFELYRHYRCSACLSQLHCLCNGDPRARTRAWWRGAEREAP